MADAVRDDNRVPVLMAVSSADGITPIPVMVNPATGRLLAEAAVGGGDMTKVVYDPANIAEQLVGLIAAQTLTNKILTSPVINTTISGTAVLDEDNMVSDSNTRIATQQSIKAYVDANAALVAIDGAATPGYLGATGGGGVLRVGGLLTYADGGDFVTINVNEGALNHTGILNIGTNTHAQIDTHVADGTVHFTEASIDHTGILNIGTNTHAQIDTHVADATIHFTEASIDHTGILNIGTNTHAQIDTAITNSVNHIASTANPHSVTLQQAFDGGQTITVADNDNQTFVYTNSDITNNPITFQIENDGTNHNLYIKQDGVLASDKHGLYIYSNAIQINSPLVRILQDNANSTESTLSIRNYGLPDARGIDVFKSSAGIAGDFGVTGVGGEGVCLQLVTLSNLTTAIGIEMAIYSSGGDKYAFKFSGNEHDTAGHGGTAAGRIRILEGANIRYIYFYSD